MVSRLTKLARDMGLVSDKDEVRTKRWDKRDKPKHSDKMLGQAGQSDKMLGQAGQSDKVSVSRYDVKAKLLAVLEDPKAPPQSRASAGRTLAEIEGLIGRHQQAPTRTAITPIGALSRSELEAELQRLRDKVQLSR